MATEAAADSGDGGGTTTVQAAEATETATEAPTLTPVSTESMDTGVQVTEAVSGSGGFSVSPGVAFFLGGLLVITVLVGWWAYRTYA